MAYEIPLDANIDALLRKFDRVIERGKQVDQVVSGIGSGMGSGGGGGSVGTGPRPKLGGGPRDYIMPYVRGPYEQRARVQRALDIAQDDTSRKDAQVRLDAVNKRIARIEGSGSAKTQQQLIMEALMTSRIGAGGQLFPLVNRLMAAGLSGPEALQGQMTGMGMDAGAARAALPYVVGGAAGAIVAGVGVALAEGAAKSIRSGSNNYWSSGGTPSEVGQMMALGGENAGGKSVAFGDWLRQGGLGSSYFRSKGIFDAGVYTADKGANYLHAIDVMRAIPTDRQAIMMTRGSPLAEDLWMRDLDKGTYDQLRGSMGDMGSADARRSEATYRANKAILGNTWDRYVVRGIGGNAMGRINELLSNPFSYAARNSGPGMIFGGLKDHIWDPVAGFVSSHWMPYNRWGKAASKSDGGSGFGPGIATSDAGRAGRDEVIGGGPEARGALPAGWKAPQMQSNIDTQSIRFGAFSVS